VQFPLPETGWAWNGTFNGAPLPSDDYWYSIKLEDGREIKGHFSLIR
jgi:gliding motility-associated-like protein